MRYALLDNATLTSVQRIFGEIKLKNKASIDMDIAALEHYIQSILFYDKIFTVDDYKDEFSLSRKKYFQNITFFKKDSIKYDQLLNQTQNICNNVYPKIEFGKITDEYFSSFFEQLKMHMVFTWDLSSSKYFLTQKILIDEMNYNQNISANLMSSIFSEAFLGYNLEEAVENKNVLRDSTGIIGDNHNIKSKNGYKEGYISDQLETFLSALNWLSNRTVFYTLVSEQLNADLFLHPIRQSFNINLMRKYLNLPYSKISNLLESMNSETKSTLFEIKDLTDNITICNELPLFLTWIIDKVKDPSKIIDECYNIREDKLFINCRDKLDLIDNLIEDKNVQKYVTSINKILSEIKNEMELIKVKYGISTNQGISSSKFISFYNIFATFTGLIQLPDFDINIPQLEFLKDIKKRKGFKGVYRNIISDLTAIERLGSYHELITKNVWLDKEAQYYYPKTEEKKFVNIESFWKIPMK
ncbi:MAG: hypothetical protein A2Y34_15865 [Spirochaetes bacterium GWC1_27_15]|nr:MAG: hypothetical protein A2Z98_18525 [Spirochaetes bacterium GWB1_27_13]OHD27298.1 MAG: hypothetical protein A2Y34_15865 [Spirochaetes bacterium GWC1_27_15]